MSIDNVTPPPADEDQAAYDEWAKVRENPEDVALGVNRLDVAELSYYRLNPPAWEFHDDYFSVSVGVCGYHGHLPIGPRDLHPNIYAEHVLLGINGTTGTRLVNVLLERDEAQQLADLLKKAAKKVARDV
ncbi:MAG: hypothetical protein P4L48_23555 [Mycobacterium sp.]|nr:hypothetical protein [Mycobacterium sp.]MDR3662020.1 hypothetical protein [Mycobacterium sp.]